MSELAGHADLVDSLDGGSLDGGSLDGSTMTDPIADEPEPVDGNFARVRLANGPLVGPILWRVVSMMLARADWPLERVDDMLLVCDALSAQTFLRSSNATVAFSIQASEHEAELRVLDLTDDGATGLIQDTMLPVVGNVLERIAERVSVESGARGEGSELVLVLRARSPQQP
jgi:hypothetical protein